MTEIIVIHTTTGTRHDAEKIAAALVDARLAACVQVSGPIESTYRWQGVQQTTEEWLVTIKTRHELFANVEQAILKLHPYEQPEIIALPVEAVNVGYERWLNAALEPQK